MDISVSCRKSDIFNALRHLKAAISKKNMHSTKIDIRVLTNQVDFNIPGASFSIYCKTGGKGKVSVYFYSLFNLIQLHKDPDVNIVIDDEYLNLGATSIRVSVKEMSDDSVLRKIDLPINYTELDILRLRLHYTPEELQFNNLHKLLEKAEDQKEPNIRAAHKVLKGYGIEYKDLENLVEISIYGDAGILL